MFTSTVGLHLIQYEFRLADFSGQHKMIFLIYVNQLSLKKSDLKCKLASYPSLQNDALQHIIFLFRIIFILTHCLSFLGLYAFLPKTKS